jgi:transcriptional regulator with XRE-family HTH domain
MINAMLQEKNMTKYRLAKLSDVPYTTVNDICSGRADVRKCSADTVYRISKALGIAMENIIESYYDRPDFELFKSAVCHQLKEKGDNKFIIDLLKENRIDDYYDKKWYPECFYLLAMLDYLCRENEVPICRDYSELRKQKLSTLVYPSSVITLSSASKNDKAKREALKRAIPEFLRHNIVESEIRNVI